MVLHRAVAPLLACLALLLAPAGSRAEDDGDGDGKWRQASSRQQPAVVPCEQGDKTEACPMLAALATKVDAAFAAALKRVAPRTAPLLARDEVWLGESIPALREREEGDATTELVETMLRDRVAVLEGIADGVGRRGLAGKWANAFADAEITAGRQGALVLSSSLHRPINRREAVVAEHGPQDCRARAVLRPLQGGWFAGRLEAEPGNGDKAGDAAPEAETGKEEALEVRVRLQGETLRVVVGAFHGKESIDLPPACGVVDQITGTYFAIGKAADGHVGAASPPPFTAPTFDCTHLDTADQEEICADPELAANDVRLNQAWSRLQPRLDAATRRHLLADQRRYVISQVSQYPEFLHPAWDKSNYAFHQLGYARDMLARLQRERIAMLEGFDEDRRGLEGLWLAADAIIAVQRDKDGGLIASGRKWFQGDWKAGCAFDMKGSLKDGAFRSAEPRQNPDTLERDGATLVVNRQDAAFAEKREYDERTTTPGDDAPKCRRNYHVSSTSRLFPVRPSVHIDSLGEDAIR